MELVSCHESFVFNFSWALGVCLGTLRARGDVLGRFQVEERTLISNKLVLGVQSITMLKYETLFCYYCYYFCYFVFPTLLVNTN